ncbi:MAG: FkbM family methyltransferase [Saprospiraceae bacterium]
MNGFLTYKFKQLKHYLLPEFLERKYILSKESSESRALKNEILDYTRGIEMEDKQEIIQFLENNPLTVYPYNFTDKYSIFNIEVFHDNSINLPFVIYLDKKLYFKRGMSDLNVKFAMRNLLIEQDSESPHNYDNFLKKEVYEDIVIDAGAAEGIFVLGNIEKFKKVILVESDKEWIEPLQASFNKFPQVTIINKFISDINDEQNISIDELVKDQKVDLLKIDVDGNEDRLIKGAHNLLTKGCNEILLCIYHAQEDHVKYNDFFKSLNYNTTTSQKYMLFYLMGTFEKPYFRRGLLVANK